MMIIYIYLDSKNVKRTVFFSLDIYVLSTALHTVALQQLNFFVIRRSVILWDGQPMLSRTTQAQ